MNEILIYGTVSDENLDLGAMLKQLRDAKESDLTVRINSVGGNLYTGVTVYNMLKNYKGKVTTVIDGYAASVASLIAMAGDEIIMGSNTCMLLHNPYFPYAENLGSNELQSLLERNIQDTAIAVSVYKERTGQDEETVKAWLDNRDHIYSAADCLAMKLCTQVTEAVEFAEMKVTGRIETKLQEFINTNKQTITKMTIEELEVLVNALTEKVDALEAATKEDETPVEDTTETEASDTVETTEAVAEDVETETQVDALAMEQERKESIKQYVEKYNADGSLNTILLDAVMSDKTLDAVKDEVTEALSKRPVNGKVITKTDKTETVMTEKQYQEKLGAAKSHTERAALVTEYLGIKK